MMKNNPFAGVLPFRHGSSVPLVGGTVTLAAALAAFERAEQVLESARATARAAARREGVSVSGLFAKSSFIRRETGERWADTGRAEGEKAMANILSRSLSTEALDEKSPFKHLARRLERNRAEGVTMADLARLRDRMEEAGAFEAMQRGDVKEAARICAELQREATGGRIVRAAARARMGGPEIPAPESGSFAARVAAAARKARGED